MVMAAPGRGPGPRISPPCSHPLPTVCKNSEHLISGISPCPSYTHNPEGPRSVYPTLWKTTLFGTALEFHAYTFFLALAFLVGTLLPVRENYRQANPYPITPIGGLWVFFGALIGAKAYWQLQYGEPGDWFRVFRIWEGGLVFYGGLFGGILGGYLYVRGVGAPVWKIGDLALPFVPLAHAVARLGCFLNGCCWGSRTDLPWAVHYPKAFYGVFQQQVDAKLIDYSHAHTLGVHPSQLYESAGLVCIFFIMRRAYKKPHRTGEIMLLYPLCYGVLRFFTEATRGDSARPLFSALTASQGVAIGFVVFAFSMYAILSIFVWPRTEPNSENLESHTDPKQLSPKDDVIS